MTYEFLQTLYSDILLMLERLVVKRTDLAREEETTETALAFELYYACLTGSRYFYNFKKFDIDILQKYLSPAEVSECYDTPKKIPEKYRAMIVEEQSQRVIDTYEEKNNYYRMLAGLPDVNDHRWIYVSDVEGIPFDVPIHQLSYEQISHLEVIGYVDKLKEQYPNAKYLDYLGVESIDFVTARLAKPFEILRLGSPANSRTQTMFEDEYYKARRYTMATIYNRQKFTNKTLYDPIIGVLMLTLAIRNTLVPDEVDYLNFEEILDAILESYGLLDYFKNFPFTFKRRLVLAMDNILKVKGTDGVLVDICRIFSFDNFEAKRYFLTKTYKKDRDGNIIFDEDPENQYDLNFTKATIREHDIDYGEESTAPYEQITNNDYLWQLTDEEKHNMMNEDFNLMMTKYIDIEAAYDLSSLTFEVCYFINLLLQSRDNEMKIRCTNMYARGGSSELYTMTIFLLAGLAKRSRFDGNIVYEESDVAEILRFNYNDISAAIKEITDKYEKQVDVNDQLIPGYESPPALDKPYGQENNNGMVDVYIFNRELYNAIIEEMHTANDIRKYIALANAKECMYISYMEHKDFTKTDGTYAKTYYEMLQDVDPHLAQKLDAINLDKDANELDKMLLYILEKLEDLFSTPELKYLFLNTPNTYGTLISKYLRMAINVFKASSVQLDSINVFFNAGDAEPIRVIDQKIIHKTMDVKDTIYITEEVAFHKTLIINDSINVMDKGYVNE